MDDFNINNNNIQNGEGNMDGFDSAENISSGNGYTVTPEGGFYTKPKEEIIQDEVFESKTESEPQPQPAYTQPQTSYTQPNHSPHYSTSQPNYYNQTPPYGYKPPKVKKPREKKTYGAGIIALAVILAIIMGAISGAAVVFLTQDEQTVTIEQPGVSGNNVNINIDETAESVVEAVATKVTPSVVGIRTTTSVMSFFGDRKSVV